MSRKKVSPAVETDLLVKTRRRCCLCVYLDGDLTRKRLQIAHIGHNPKNSAESDLVPLCLDHHDEYDSITRISKRISRHELTAYKRRLIDEILRGAIPLQESSRPPSEGVALETPDLSASLFRQYGALFSRVTRVLFERDPVGINFGGNADEYDAEAHDILSRLQRKPSSDRLPKICQDVFAQWFTSSIAAQFKDYDVLALDIWQAWEAFDVRRHQFSEEPSRPRNRKPTAGL